MATTVQRATRKSHLIIARKLREAKGLTQALCARQLGVSQSCLALWEAGKRGAPLSQVERYLALLVAAPVKR